MWSWKGVIPRIKSFLWKAIHNGLPTAATLHSRIRSISAVCQRCDTENEFIMHLLFFCDLSRATWFCSEFPLMVDHLPLNFQAAMLHITDNLSEDHIIAVCNLLWCLWKARNEELFTAKKSTPQTIVPRAKAMRGATQERHTDITRRVCSQVQIPTGKDIILIDGSWDTKGETGTSMICSDRYRRLCNVQGSKTVASDPLQAEAIALMKALTYAIDNRAMNRSFIIYTDCKVLFKAVQGGSIQDLPSWKTCEEVARCINLVKETNDNAELRHTPRENLIQPHMVANMFRRAPQEGHTQGLQLAEILGLKRQLDNSQFILDQ